MNEGEKSLIMKINVKVIPGAKVEQIQKALPLSSSGLTRGSMEHLKVWVKGKPVEGEANRAVVALLAKHFGVPKSSVIIVKGLTSRNKIIEINI